jgi:predicted PurR-regulated permease PerM
MKKNLLSKSFLITLVVASLVACYFVFRPFLSEILTAMILATIFYRPFEWLARKLGGHRNIAATIMCLAIVLIVIIPLINIFILGAKESITAYGQAADFFNKTDWSMVIKSSPLAQIQGLNLTTESIQSFVMDLIQKSSNVLMGSAAGFIKGTTNFIISMIFIVLSMFFFFVDGKRMLEKLMALTPLPNKYDRTIFKKFQDVSFSFIFSTFIVAIIQGFACWLGLFIISLPFFFNLPTPALFAGVVAAFLSMIPFLGAWLIWLPAAIFLLATGHVGAAIFLTIWGIAIIHPVDNIIRPLILRKKAEVHPIFLLFSILGGIALFGFPGLIIGPLIVAVTITIFHIYELEYKDELEK